MRKEKMKLKEYQNKEWLFNKYWNEELSQKQIRKLCRTTRFTIRYWMKKLNIPRRSSSKSVHLARANHCKLSQKSIEWINGELLGDGSLYSYSPYSAGFTYSSKYLEYCQYVSDTLRSFGIEQSGKIIKKNHKNIIHYGYHSRSYKELLPLYQKWYIDGKKAIPKNLRLTPLTIRQHYIGDGSLIHQGGNTRIILCTCGFSILSVNWLVQKLNNLGFKAMRQPSLNTIHISTYSVKNFLTFIGRCPVKCYQYKWEY